MGTAATTPKRAESSLLGLDALRAFAIVGILAYHLMPRRAPGGFLGVEVFFVLSGFLITRGLCNTWERDGAISLRAFLKRRINRLYSPMLVMLLTCTTIAAALASAIGGDVLVGVDRQIFGAFTFTSNWVTIATGGDYFSATAPVLFANLWFLALTVQFYLLWPPLVVLLLRRVQPTLRWVCPAALALASAALMAGLSVKGVGITRLYEGTDTHFFALLGGAALAFAFAYNQRALAWLHSRLSLQWAITFGGSAGLGLLVLAARLHWDSDRSFQGLMFGAALASVFILWLILGFPQLGARLEVWPLRWLGQKSYGIFLWHWPLLVITLAAFGRRPYASKWWVIALVLASTLAMTALTERLVHAPLHTLGLRGYFRRVWQLPRFARVAIATIAATGLIGTAAAAATAPSQSEITRQILAGAEAASLTRQDAHPVPPHPVPPHVTEPVALPDTAATVPVGAELLDGGLFDQEVAAQAAQVQPPDGVELTAIGDSVLLGAVPQLLEQLPGIYIDGAVSRQFRHALPILADLNEAELLRPYVLIALATNGAVKPEAIDRVLAEIGPDRVALFVTGYGERVWIAESNETLAAAAARYPGQVVLVDWNAAVSADPELLGGDGIHPSVPGMERYAQLVAEALAQTGVAGRD